MIGNSFRHMYVGASQQLGGTSPSSSPMSAQAAKLLAAIRQVVPEAGHSYMNNVVELTRHPITPTEASTSKEFTNLTNTLNHLTPAEQAQVNHNFGHNIFGANGKVNETALYHTIYGNGHTGGNGNGPLIANQSGHGSSNTVTPATSTGPSAQVIAVPVSAPNLTSAALIGSFEVQA